MFHYLCNKIYVVSTIPLDFRNCLKVVSRCVGYFQMARTFFLSSSSFQCCYQFSKMLQKYEFGYKLLKGFDNLFLACLKCVYYVMELLSGV